MKKLSKVLVLALAAMLVVCGLTACSSSSDGKMTNTEGKIVFGTNAEFPPFEFVDANGILTDAEKTNKYDGIDMAIAKQIGEDSGMEVEISNMEFDSLLVALQNGQLDAVIAGMTVTDERKQSVDFTDTYYTATQVIIVPENSDITKATDLKDKKIVCVQGYTGQTCLDELKNTAGGGYEYQAFKKGTEAVMEVANGKADAFVIDSATAEKYVNDNKGLKIVKDADAFADEEYAIAVKKGNSELLKVLNDSIKKMKDAGKVSEFAAKYSVAE